VPEHKQILKDVNAKIDALVDAMNIPIAKLGEPSNHISVCDFYNFLFAIRSELSLLNEHYSQMEQR